MPEQFSGLPASSEFGTGPPPADPSLVALLAVLAVLMAIAAALGGRGRQRLIAQLALVADDWERAGTGQALKEAAARFIRPALAMLQADDG